MDLRQLRYFVTVAELGSFTAAARRLYIAQSALSRQIANLEADLGAALFYRVGKRVHLAPAGERVREAARKLLSDCAELRNLAQLDAREISGEIALGAHPSDGDFLFPDLLRRTAAERPGIKLDVVQAQTAELQELLLNGRLDAAILTFPDPLPGCSVTPLARENLFFLGVSPLAATLGPECNLAEVIGLPLIVPHRPSRERAAYEELARHHGVKLQVAIEAEGLPLMKLLARQGIGNLILPYTAIHAELLDTTNWRSSRIRDLQLSRILACRAAAMPKVALAEVTRLLRAQIGEFQRQGAFLPEELEDHPATTLPEQDQDH